MLGPDDWVDPQLFPKMSPTIDGGAPGNPAGVWVGWWVHVVFLGCADEYEGVE
jgi:hypothetical protein